MVIYYLIASFSGLAVASAEIISRYKGSPLDAVFSRWGGAYLLFNGALSAFVFYILMAMETVSTTSSSIDSLKYALGAGFGAMVIIRAKLFDFKIPGGAVVSIGPDAVIDIWLGLMDRQIDRKQAYKRAEVVMECMEDIDFKQARMPMITLLSRSMQNVSEHEMRELGRRVKELENAEELENQEKSYALGFMVLDIAGSGFFDNVFDEGERKKYKVKGGE